MTQVSTDGVAALAEPTRPVGRRFTAAFVFAAYAQWLAVLVPVQLLLPRQLAQIDDAAKLANFAVVASAGALVAMVMGPLWGAASDRTTARLGRRHPWRLFGAAWMAAGFVTLGQATSFGAVLAIVVVQEIGGAALGASFAAAIPDRVPPMQRGRFSAYHEIAQRAALVSGTAAASVLSIGAGYTALAALVAVSTAVFVAATPDAALPREAVPPWDWRRFLAGFWVSPRRHPDFAWGVATRLLFVLGVAFATAFLLFLLQDAVGYGNSAETGVTILIVVGTATAAPVTYLGGRWSDRTGRRKVLLAGGAALFAAGCLVVAVSPTWPAVLGACALIGAGIGGYAAVDGPIAAAVLPRAEDRARHLAVATAALIAPQVIAPAAGGPIVAVGGYPALYALAAGSALLAAVAVLRIRSVR